MSEFHVFHSSCRKCSTPETDSYGNQIYVDYTSSYQQETQKCKIVFCVFSEFVCYWCNKMKM